MESIGTMVGTLARAKGLSIGAFAAAMGMHRNRLTARITGRQEFSEREIRRAAKILGVTPGRLFEDPLELLGVSTSQSESTWTTSVAA
jgi:transcriptional regulator with XRE-family HTH domain